MSNQDPRFAFPMDVDGLVFACLLDGNGGGKPLDWAGLETWRNDDGPLWVHLDRGSPRAQEWLAALRDIPDEARRALAADETRPRALTVDSGLVTILRGINFNVGADLDDMVAIRVWTDAHRVITLRYRRMMTPRDILDEIINRGGGPRTAPELFAKIAERLTERMNSVIIGLDEQLDDIEERLEAGDFASLRREVTNLRQTCVRLRRYIGPQREAYARLQTDSPPWLGANLRIALRESGDRLQRYIEDLDAARDRAVVIRDEIANQLSEAMNRNMYALSIVAGVFLPLGFLTGLLGINVGGMPGVDGDHAFWITCALLVVVLVGEILLFRRLKWF